MNHSPKRIDLHQLKRETGLPLAWLKRLVKAGAIPAVQAGRRYWVEPETALAAIKAMENVKGGGR